MPYTQIENLSNEIFYEIFEYIEYNELLNAFSNLNNRIENLLNYQYLSLKITVGFDSASEVKKHCTQIITPNKHRIVSLYLTDRSHINVWSPLHIIDSSFNRLKSLILNRVRHQEFISFYPILTSLSYLRSITIHLNDNTVVELSEIYRLIFLLTSLDKFELSANEFSLAISLPINTFKYHSNIKHLIINHACNLKELICLLSYTPLLTHLICMKLTQQNEDILRVVSMNMLYLTNITFNMCDAPFDELEYFIIKLCKSIRVLSINTSGDITYLDANRWEQLISKYMIYLRIFKFEYHDYHYHSIELSTYHNLLNQFTSSFWIDRGWVFEIITDIDYWPPINIIYSIHSDRKSCFQMCKQTNDIKLTIKRLYFARSRQELVDEFFLFFSNFHITHLIVDCKKLIYTKFIQLLSKLPNLHTLEILSLSSFKTISLSQQDIELVESWSKHNKITRLIIKSFIEKIDLNKIQYFIDLCIYMKYLEVKCENNVNIETIIRYILYKNIDKFLYLNLFCLCLPITNDDIIKQIQIIINLEKFIQDYKITRTSERIYIEWKLK